jgi:GTP-binding protein
MREIHAKVTAGQPDPVKNNDTLKLSIIGRPNAGKSTLVNALIGEERVITGPEAGITRDSIAIEWNWRGKPVRLTDTAGMRRKARVEEKLEKLSVAETLRAIQFAEVCVLVMDAREAFEKQDLQIADLVIREGRAIVYALAKWDLVEDPQKAFEELKNKANRLLPQSRGAPLVRLSALAGRGTDALMEAAFGVYEDWNTRIKTGELNRWLREAMERNPPPVVDGKRVKPRYITQVKARPPTFVLVCSRAAKLPETYQRFLLNGIRDAFGLPAVPMRIYVRQNSKNPFADEKD